jgi:hypothetical protein
MNKRDNRRIYTQEDQTEGDSGQDDHDFPQNLRLQVILCGIERENLEEIPELRLS